MDNSSWRVRRYEESLIKEWCWGNIVESQVTKHSTVFAGSRFEAEILYMIKGRQAKVNLVTVYMNIISYGHFK